MIVLIDNYDSFTFNLLQYIAELSGPAVTVKVLRNDAAQVEDIAAMAPSHIVISPGPCTPNEAGISVELIQELHGVVPILGVCLGHQAIIQAFGGVIVRAKRIMHGKTSRVLHSETSVFEGLPNPLEVTRYHSLLGDPATMPACLEVLAHSEDCPEEIMAVRHRQSPSTVGVQFHPEAILTRAGKDLLRTFLKMGASEHEHRSHCIA